LDFIFSANDDPVDCKMMTKSDHSDLCVSRLLPENFRNLQLLSSSARIISPDSVLASSRDDDVGSSLSSTSADEMNKLYEQVSAYKFFINF
jgi:hypothetical protein